MALIVLLAQLKGERRVGIAALGAAAVALLLIDPFLAQDLAFLLSILATAGIIVYSPIVSSWLKSKLSAPKPLSDLIAIPFSATLFTLPIVVAISLSARAEIGAAIATLCKIAKLTTVVLTRRHKFDLKNCFAEDITPCCSL